MSEELLQTDPISIGGRYSYLKLGASTLRQLKNAGIIKASIPKHLESKKPDGLIMLRGGAVKAVVEYKPAAKLRTERQIRAAIEQEIEAAAVLCKLLVVTSGSKSIWINPCTGNRVLTASGNVLDFIVDVQAIIRASIDAEELERLLDAADASLTDTNDIISAPSVLDPSSLAGAIWQKIWVETGKSPEKCLYNVVELFVFKFLSDLGVLSAHHNFWSVEALAGQDPRDSLKHYANICRREVQELFPPAVDDGTTIINGTIFVNEDGEPNLVQATLFSKIIKDLADYDNNKGSFRYIEREFKTRLYESFLRQSAGVKALGQYFTPRNVVRAMVKMARQLNSGARICDPFCGVGGFLLELLVDNQNLFNQFAPRSPSTGGGQITIVGYDKGTDEQEDDRTIILAKANMLIYFSDLLAKHHSREDLRVFAENGLNTVFRLLRTNLGTFDRTTDDMYDLILTNPPYVTKGSRGRQETIAQSPHMAQFYDMGLKGTEGLALNWILKKLRPGGEAIIIVPDSLLRRTRELQALRAHCIVRAIVSLPKRTFYATPRQTYILALEKKTGNQEQDEPVFAYVVQEIGETRNAKRIRIERNDLVEMASLFRQFRGDPIGFRCSSSQCKVVPFEDVARRDDWRVDRWWTYEERIELGLDEARPVVKDGDFVSEVEGFADELRGMTKLYREQDSQEVIHYKKVSLSDSTVFSFITSRTGWSEKVLHELVVQDEDAIPVYTASSYPFGRVPSTHSGVIHADEDHVLISFASNGDSSAGTNFVLHDSPFYVTNDRTVIRLVDGNVDPRYLLYAMRNMKAAHGFDHTHKAVPKNLGVVSIDIPITNDGQWDLNAQKEIAKRHNLILEIRSKLIEQTAVTGRYNVEIGYAPAAD